MVSSTRPSSGVRESFYGDPATDPDCARYGCAEGRACERTGDCANGLSCINSKCQRYNPFTRENILAVRQANPAVNLSRDLAVYQQSLSDTDASDNLLIGSEPVPPRLPVAPQPVAPQPVVPQPAVHVNMTEVLRLQQQLQKQIQELQNLASSLQSQQLQKSVDESSKAG
jgi:hypothetical protein